MHLSIEFFTGKVSRASEVKQAHRVFFVAALLATTGFGLNACKLYTPFPPGEPLCYFPSVPKPNCVLSVDTEATGLHEGALLLQLAFVPVDFERRMVCEELGVEFHVQCPTYNELEPTLNDWVKAHNKPIIDHCHEHGFPEKELSGRVSEYLESDPIKALFKKDRPVLLGKSLSALDIPLLNRYLGWDYVSKKFHHHTLDVTSIARFMVQSSLLPPGFQSTSKLVKHFKIRDDAKHTALSDAVDMGTIYLKMLETVEKVIARAQGGIL